MSQEVCQTELQEKTKQLMEGPLKHIRAAALAAALMPLASVAAAPAAAQPPIPCASGGVCGVVWNDTNGNGVLEPGEPGIPGVTVTICQVCDGTDTGVVVTGPDGSYSLFEPPGTYKVSVPIPTGTQVSPLNTDNVGVSNGLSSVATGVPATGLPTDFGFFTPSNSNPCVLARGDAFGLKSSAAYTVLGESFANIIFGSGATLITGDVGVGPHDTGSLEKATIKGTLFLDPTANPSIHGDLIATGGVVSKGLTTAVADADAANATNAARPATQPAITVADVPSTTITLANPSGPNVVPVTSVNTHGMIAIVGDSTASVVLNVAAGFTCNGCSIVLAATTPGGNPIRPQNVLWNFVGAGNDVSISKPVAAAQGIFLAPGRNLLLDKASLTGALIGAEGGLKLLVHSGAKLTCPQ
jgi:hypothetical protein